MSVPSRPKIYKIRNKIIINEFCFTWLNTSGMRILLLSRDCFNNLALFITSYLLQVSILRTKTFVSKEKGKTILLLHKRMLILYLSTSNFLCKCLICESSIPSLDQKNNWPVWQVCWYGHRSGHQPVVHVRVQVGFPDYNRPISTRVSVSRIWLTHALWWYLFFLEDWKLEEKFDIWFWYSKGIYCW